ncbi:MAG: med21 domain-containing protein [Firmicutes bacterium]|nr:med21 domain-containing protein [Bacillota bacterium]MCL2256557.1 med21 domain-containing protein [Bacillota bacterium]
MRRRVLKILLVAILVLISSMPLLGCNVDLLRRIEDIERENYLLQQEVERLEAEKRGMRGRVIRNGFELTVTVDRTEFYYEETITAKAVLRNNTGLEFEIIRHYFLIVFFIHGYYWGSQVLGWAFSDYFEKDEERVRVDTIGDRATLSRGKHELTAIALFHERQEE